METNDITAGAIATLAAAFAAHGMDATAAHNLAALNVELEARLAQGAVTFYYQKANGELRKAIGTNKGTIVDHHYTFKGTNRAKPTTSHSYFDLEKNCHRAYTKANLVSIAAA